jgi:hypothetical protein
MRTSKAGRRILVGSIAAGSLATAGAGIGVAATASAPTHTLRFTAVQISSKNLSQTKFVNVDKDRSHGKFIGNDVLQGRFNNTTHTAKIGVAAAFRGGFIYGNFISNEQGDLSQGKVTGGTGKYKGVKGTITGHAITSTKEAVTITYHH